MAQFPLTKPEAAKAALGLECAGVIVLLLVVQRAGHEATAPSDDPGASTADRRGLAAPPTGRTAAHQRKRLIRPAVRWSAFLENNSVTNESGSSSDDYVEETISAERAKQMLALVNRTNLTSEESDRVRGVLAEMNQEMKRGLDVHLSRALEARSPVDDATMGTFLEAWSDAEAAAEDALRAVNPAVAAALDADEVSAMSFLDSLIDGRS